MSTLLQSIGVYSPTVKSKTFPVKLLERLFFYEDTVRPGVISGTTSVGERVVRGGVCNISVRGNTMSVTELEF